MNIVKREMAMEVSEAVQNGAETLANIKVKARKIRKLTRDLRASIEAVHKAGHIGGLEAHALSSEADALAVKFEADWWALHSRWSRRCQELGIDLPAPVDVPTPFGGGTR